MQSHFARSGRLTAQQAATLLGVTLGNLRVLVHRGQLQRAGGTRYQPQYALADVTALYAARNAGQSAPTARPPLRESA
jgi:hypothetical protein